MPLPAPDYPREPAHRRSISIQSYARPDGLWDLEGHLTDVWPTPVPMTSGKTLPAGSPMHAMWLRLTLDRTATIVAVQAVTDAGPYGEACGAITPDYSKLIGVQVARGYRDAIRRLLGRTAGCTHMNELAGAMGSAAMQAMWGDLKQDPDQKPFSIDGCHALASGSAQVMQYFPRWYRPAAEFG